MRKKIIRASLRVFRPTPNLKFFGKIEKNALQQLAISQLPIFPHPEKSTQSCVNICAPFGWPIGSGRTWIGKRRELLAMQIYKREKYVKVVGVF